MEGLWNCCRRTLRGLRNILICGRSDAASHPLGCNRMAAWLAEAHAVERVEVLTAHASLDVRLLARMLLEQMFSAEPWTADLQPVPNVPANT